jgi:hypothetical protein
MVELPGSMKLARQTCCTGFEGDIPSAPNHCQLYLKLRGAEVGLMTGAWMVTNPDGFTWTVGLAFWGKRATASGIGSTRKSRGGIPGSAMVIAVNRGE